MNAYEYFTEKMGFFDPNQLVIDDLCYGDIVDYLEEFAQLKLEEFRERILDTEEADTMGDETVTPHKIYIDIDYIKTCKLPEL